MKKYIYTFFSLIITDIRFLMLKLFNFGSFKFSFFNLISPFIGIELGRKSEFCVGKMVRIKSGTKIKVRDNAQIIIGENSSFNHNCMLISHERIIIGNNVQFGPNVIIYDHDHDYKLKDGLKKLIYKKAEVIIGNNVWVGANTIILRGSKIGDNCVIGAGSVIKGIYKENTLIVQKKNTTITQII